MAERPQDRYERLLSGGGTAGRRLAAACSQARREVPAASGQARAIRDVAAGVAGPLLVAYVLWLLLDARARGIERLYFLSRDGQVLHGLADILAPRLGIDVERRYLYSSRKAWKPARGVRLVHSYWLWKKEDGRLTLDILLGRLAVPRAKVEADLADLDLPGFDAALGAAEIDRVREYFGSGRFAAAAATTLTENRSLLRDHLRQEGIFDAVPKATVDLGWRGSQHETLCDLLVEEGAEPFPCYLFGARAYPFPWSDLRRGFYFDKGETGEDPLDGALPPRDLSMLMGAFCTADHGTLKGFRRSGDRVEPDLAAAPTEELNAWGLPVLRETIYAVARSIDLDGLDPRALDPHDTPTFRATIDRLLEAFWLAPTEEEARAWGNFGREAGQGSGSGTFFFAEPYARGDILSVWRHGALRKREIFWVEGALALTPRPLATVLRGVCGMRQRMTRIRRGLSGVGVGRAARTGARST